MLAKKNFSFILFFTIFSVAAISQYSPVDFEADSEQGIQFYRGAWQEALDLAKKENKLIFLDVYATWCGPCKKLKATSFADAQVGQFFNTHFINVALDGEKGEGLEVAKKYKVKGYPTLLFINGEGKIVDSGVGYHSPKKLLSLGEEISSLHQRNQSK